MGVIHHKSRLLESEFQLSSEGRLTELDFSINTKLGLTPPLAASPNPYKAEDSISVSWSGIQCPNSADWIGVFAPGLYEISSSSDTGYIDWFYVSDVSSSWSQGYGAMTFNDVMNLRTPIEFRYFSKNTSCTNTPASTWSLVTISPPVNPVDVNEPTEIHIAVGESYESIYVMFVTNSPDIPTVFFGTDENNLLNSAQGTTDYYTAEMMCGSPASTKQAPYFSEPGHQHKVKLTGLKPSTKYYYKVGVSSFSDVHSFITQPENGSAKTVRIFAMGDMGAYQEGTKGTLARIEEHLSELDIILHIGDLSYAFGYGIEWDVFGNLIETSASQVPWMVSIGNHEYDHTSGGEKDPSGASGQGWHPTWGNFGGDSYGECGVPPYHRFTAPISPSSNAIFWYDFAYGSAYIIQISSEHDVSPGSIQYQYLQATLSSIDRNVFPWVILTIHRPMYTSENYASDYRVAVNLQELLEPLLLQYKVDVVLAGHYHSYERTCIVNNLVCVDGDSNTNGIVHVVVGMAGMSLDNESYMKKDWSIYHDQAFGYSTLDVNRTTLNFQYYHNVDDKIYDSFVLRK